MEKEKIGFRGACQWIDDREQIWEKQKKKSNEKILLLGGSAQQVIAIKCAK